MLPISGKKELLAKSIAIPITALLASHYVFTQRFPWETGYRFPFIPFATVALIMSIVWYANAKIFQRLDKKIPFQRDPFRRILLQFFEGGIITIGIFVVVYGLLSLIFFRERPTVSGFTTGMLVCLVIASLVNGIYVIAYLINTISFEKLQTTEALQASLTQIKVPNGIANKVVIEIGNKTIVLSDQEIAYCYSSGGNVWMVKVDGQKLLTNYDSLAKIEHQLSNVIFFRLSRQYIVHYQSIQIVAEDVNRKLSIQLSPVFQPNTHSEVVTVSRYRAAEFPKWFASLITP